MRQTRSCEGITLDTGRSACPVDFGRIKAIILVPHGKTMGKNFTKGSFQTMCHADYPNRIYPIKTVVEYAKNGGEPQVSTVGYGTSGVSGLSPRTDVFTLDRYYENIAASLTKNMNQPFDAYYIDDNDILIGINNGTDELGGFPMNTVFPTVTPHATSSSKATMTISLVHADARKAIENIDFVELEFDPMDELEGLTPVQLVESVSGKYKIIEVIGAFDRTAEYGAAIAEAATSVLDGVTAASYADGLLTITASSGAIPALKKAQVLHSNDIDGIEYVKTIKLPTT